jgi:hypothetical protein
MWKTNEKCYRQKNIPLSKCNDSMEQIPHGNLRVSAIEEIQALMAHISLTAPQDPDTN